MAPLPVPKTLGGQLSPAKRAQLMSTASPSTPHRSPIRKKRAGVTLQQKKTLIENLRLEITERARRLRAQYHLQAQGLRSRIEIRLNRIPMALRKLKMEDLLLKYMDQEQEQQQRAVTRAPASPAKDLATSRDVHVPARGTIISPQKPSLHIPRTQTQMQMQTQTTGTGRPQQHQSSDKENAVQHGDHAKKRVGGNDARSVDISQVLSPTSSNSRMANRERPASPTKSHLAKTSSPWKAASPIKMASPIKTGSPTKANSPSKTGSPTKTYSPIKTGSPIKSPLKPGSPTKTGSPIKTTSPMKFYGTARPAAASHQFSSMADKESGTLIGGIRKVTSASNASSSSSGMAASRPRRAAIAAPKEPGLRSTTRAARRASSNSETSESSTSTLTRTWTGAKSAAGAAKRTTGAAKKGVAGGEAHSSDTGNARPATGRMLRKRA